MNHSTKAILSLIAALAATSAVAQESAPDSTLPTASANTGKPDTAKGPSNVLIQEVIVTAQKREENIQDVPVAISAFTGEQLSALGVTNTKQLGLITPGLQFSEIAGFTLVYLRGIGTDSFLPYNDPAVATYVDGLYIPAQQGLINGLGGVERVEVLKGPQGTLFGRNATGGAIDVHTKSPSQKDELSVEGELGNFNNRKAQLYGNLRITDTLAVNVSAAYNHMDSYYREAPNQQCLLCLPGAPLQNDRSEGIRTKVRWTPTEHLDFSVAGYRLLQQGSGSTVSALKYPSPLARALGINGDPNDYETQRNEPAQLQVTNATLYGNAKWALPWFDLKAIAGTQNIRTVDAYYDYDTSQEDLVSFYTHNAYNNVQTQEFQIASNNTSWLADRFKWIAGFYHLHSIGGYDPITLQVAGSGVPLDGLFGLVTSAELAQLANSPLLGQIPALTIAPGPGVRLNIHGVLRTNSYSGFAQGSFDFTDWLGLTLGGRYQVENRFLGKQYVTGQEVNGGESSPILSYHAPLVTQYNFSPKISLNLKPFQGALVYLTASKGYESGTYNGINIYTPPTYVQPERVEAYELGFKTQFLDNALRFNGAVFDNQIKNLQVTYVSLTNGGAITFENAPAAHVRGAEFDTIWAFLPTLDPGLIFTAGGSYLDSIFTQYPNGSGYDEQTGLFFAKSGNFTGNRIPRSPKVSGNLGLNQVGEAGPGTYELGGDAYYNSGFFYTAQNTPQARQATYYLLNAHGSYTYERWNLKLTLFGQNLNGRKYSFASFTEDFGTAVTLAPPRTFGVRLNWSL